MSREICHYRYVASRKIFKSRNPELIFSLQNEKLGDGDWPGSPSLRIDQRFEELKDTLPDTAVIRHPAYYTECGGAVYCIAGEGPVYPVEKQEGYGTNLPWMSSSEVRHYQDVWKSTDGVKWIKIVENGPWAPGGAGTECFWSHRLFTCDGRIWLAGGYDGSDHFKTLWSSSDGVRWTVEGTFQDMESITRVFSFKGVLYLRERLSDGNLRTWKRNPGGAFIRMDNFFDGFYGDPVFFIRNGRLWAATGSGLFITDDGSLWHELFNTSDFSKNVRDVKGTLWMSNRESGQISISQDGVIWTTTDGKPSDDFQPVRETPLDYNYTDSPAVFEYHNQLWLITGHPQGTWRSADGISWERIVSREGAGLIPRYNASVAVYKDRIWIMGGRQRKIFNADGGYEDELYLILNDIWSTEDGLRWRREPDPPWFRREKTSAVARSGELFIAGGTSWGNDYLEIWKTADGVDWEKVNYYPDMDGGDLIQPDFLNAVLFRDRLWFFGGHLGSTFLSLSPQGNWEYRKSNEDMYREPDLDNLAVIRDFRGGEKIFAWAGERLLVSVNLLQWDEVSFTPDRSLEDFIYWPDAQLAVFGNNLYLVILYQDKVYSAGIRISG
jgi:hypothetical protein